MVVCVFIIFIVSVILCPKNNSNLLKKKAPNFWIFEGIVINVPDECILLYL